MNTKIYVACVAVLTFAAGLSACNNSNNKVDNETATAPVVHQANLTVPDGFSATIEFHPTNVRL